MFFFFLWFVFVFMGLIIDFNSCFVSCHRAVLLHVYSKNQEPSDVTGPRIWVCWKKWDMMQADLCGITKSFLSFDKVTFTVISCLWNYDVFSRINMAFIGYFFKTPHMVFHNATNFTLYHFICTYDKCLLKINVSILSYPCHFMYILKNDVRRTNCSNSIYSIPFIFEYIVLSIW